MTASGPHAHDIAKVRAGLLDSSNALVPGTMTETAYDGLAALARLAAALEQVEPPPQEHRSERDYIERTIATVRNHRDADNCWPSWANIFADEIERCWAALERVEEPTPITGVWLCGGENEVTVRVEVDGQWREVIREFMPLHGNDGNIWPISHIAEIPAALDSAAVVSDSGQGTEPGSAIPETMNLLRYGVTVAPEEDCGCGYEDVPDGSVTRRRWFHDPGCRPANAAGDPREQNPTKGRSDEGDGGWDFPATRKRAGAEATSESVVPPSSEPSPASEHEAVGGSPGAAPVGPPPAPPQESADG